MFLWNIVLIFACLQMLFLIKDPDCVIHVFGDSHVLSPAWRRIQIHDKDVLLQPHLATGVKAWHLREKSTFYPKSNFYNAVKSIPKSSIIVFIFGEIDCRYGDCHT